jgi:hypothetical protein
MTATKTGGARHCFFVFPNVSIIAHPAEGGCVCVCVCGGEGLLLFFIFRIFKNIFDLKNIKLIFLNIFDSFNILILKFKKIILIYL